MKRVLYGIMLPVAISALTVGCGLTPLRSAQNTNQSHTSQPSLSFQNRTQDMPVSPDTKLDPTPADSKVFKEISAVDETGQAIKVEPSKTPVLVAAYWCPHCQRTLQLLAKNSAKLGEKPVILNVGYPKGTTLADAVRIANEEDSALDIHGFENVYNLNTNAGNLYAPKGYPTLVYEDSAGIETLYGEHVLSIWEQVLSG